MSQSSPSTLDGANICDNQGVSICDSVPARLPMRSHLARFQTIRAQRPGAGAHGLEGFLARQQDKKMNEQNTICIDITSAGQPLNDSYYQNDA